MGIGISILTALAIGAVAITMIALVYFTKKKLKELIRARQERKRKSKVAFGSTRKIVNQHAREILERAPSMTMSELEKVVDDSPYFLVDYDPKTDEESDYTMIQAENVEKRVKELFRENDGIILFD